MQSPDDVLDAGTLSNPLTDARMVAAEPNPEDLIYLSLGETWIPPASGLVGALGRIPDYAHGYTLSPYGLPALRRTLRSYITRTHHLPESGSYDMAVSQAGTRATMSDFGRLIRTYPGGSCTALVPDPGWDYQGVFAPLGFAIRRYDVTAERNWQPDPEQVGRMAGPDTLLVLNCQHNPTGSDWSPQIVSRIIETALDRKAAILIDDAYYALHEPGREPTNALRILHDLTGGSPASPWLAVRTMGKQFRSNGWGIGAMSAHPDTLAQLAEIAHRRTYGTALPLQAAMNIWLQDPASDAYLDDIRKHYAENRKKAARKLADDLGFPDDTVHPGTCTSYMRFQVPTRFVQDNDEENYRKLCLEAGVLPGRGSMTAPGEKTGSSPNPAYVRIPLGHPWEVLDQAFERLRKSGLGWV